MGSVDEIRVMTSKYGSTIELVSKLEGNLATFFASLSMYSEGLSLIMMLMILQFSRFWSISVISSYDIPKVRSS